MYMTCDITSNRLDAAYEEVLHHIDYIINSRPVCNYVIIGIHTDLSSELRWPSGKAPVTWCQLFQRLISRLTTSWVVDDVKWRCRLH